MSSYQHWKRCNSGNGMIGKISDHRFPSNTATSACSGRPYACQLLKWRTSVPCVRVGSEYRDGIWFPCLRGAAVAQQAGWIRTRVVVRSLGTQTPHAFNMFSTPRTGPRFHPTSTTASQRGIGPTSHAAIARPSRAQDFPKSSWFTSAPMARRYSTASTWW